MEDQVRYLHLLGNPFSGIQQIGDQVKRKLGASCAHISFNELTDYGRKLPLGTGSSISNHDGAVHALLMQETSKLRSLRKSRKSRAASFVVTSGFLQTKQQVRMAKLLGVLNINSGCLFFRALRVTSKVLWQKAGTPVPERTFTRGVINFERDSPGIEAELSSTECQEGEVHVDPHLRDARDHVLHIVRIRVGMIPQRPHLRVLPYVKQAVVRVADQRRFNPVPRAVIFSTASV